MGERERVYPVFLRLEGARVLVVGGGPVAASKLDRLLAAGAAPVVVAPAISAGCRRDGVELVERGFEERDLDGARFVIAAAPPEVNRAVAAAAAARNLFVNAADDPAAASAYLGGVVRRGDVTVAISTGGAAPALAGLLREALDAMLPEELDLWLELARRERVRWKADATPMEARRGRLLEALLEARRAAAGGGAT
jgi:uroporphyrin-III C-methyltransferase/precorrin-2 dehydrogenase/sirohydrochlorin ferrochelatase